MSVQLEFVGHACFRLWQDGRPAIVMDPYTVALPLAILKPRHPTIVVLEPSGYTPTTSMN